MLFQKDLKEGFSFNLENMTSPVECLVIMCYATTDIYTHWLMIKKQTNNYSFFVVKACLHFFKKVAFCVHMVKPIMRQVISLSGSLHFDKTVNVNGISKGYSFGVQLLK